MQFSQATERKGTSSQTSSKRSFCPHPVFIILLTLNLFFPVKKKLSPFSYENPILSSRLGYPSSFRFLWDSGTLSSPQLSTGSPVLSQQPHFKFFQLIASQTRTSSLHSARQAQNVFFTTSGLVRSSVSCMRDPTRSSSEVYKRWAVITSPRAHTRIRGNARI